MHILIANQIGRVHHGAGHAAFQKTRPTYAFIPEAFFNEVGFEKSRYLVSRWPSINAGANPLAVGSHVIPDAQKPVSIRNRCPILREFLRRIEQIAAVKTIAVA
jgi:hypothetical protein